MVNPSKKRASTSPTGEGPSAKAAGKSRNQASGDAGVKGAGKKKLKSVEDAIELPMLSTSEDMSGTSSMKGTSKPSQAKTRATRSKTPKMMENAKEISTIDSPAPETLETSMPQDVSRPNAHVSENSQEPEATIEQKDIAKVDSDPSSSNDVVGTLLPNPEYVEEFLGGFARVTYYKKCPPPPPHPQLMQNKEMMSKRIEELERFAAKCDAEKSEDKKKMTALLGTIEFLGESNKLYLDTLLSGDRKRKQEIEVDVLDSMKKVRSLVDPWVLVNDQVMIELRKRYDEHTSQLFWKVDMLESDCQVLEQRRKEMSEAWKKELDEKQDLAQQLKTTKALLEKKKKETETLVRTESRKKNAAQTAPTNKLDAEAMLAIRNHLCISNNMMDRIGNEINKRSGFQLTSCSRSLNAYAQLDSKQYDIKEKTIDSNGKQIHVALLLNWRETLSSRLTDMFAKNMFTKDARDNDITNHVSIMLYGEKSGDETKLVVVPLNFEQHNNTRCHIPLVFFDGPDDYEHWQLCAGEILDEFSALAGIQVMVGDTPHVFRVQRFYSSDRRFNASITGHDETKYDDECSHCDKFAGYETINDWANRNDTSEEDWVDVHRKLSEKEVKPQINKNRPSLVFKQFIDIRLDTLQIVRKLLEPVFDDVKVQLERGDSDHATPSNQSDDQVASPSEISQWQSKIKSMKQERVYWERLEKYINGSIAKRVNTFSGVEACSMENQCILRYIPAANYFVGQENAIQLCEMCRKEYHPVCCPIYFNGRNDSEKTVCHKCTDESLSLLEAVLIHLNAVNKRCRTASESLKQMKYHKKVVGRSSGVSSRNFTEWMMDCSIDSQHVLSFSADEIQSFVDKKNLAKLWDLLPQPDDEKNELWLQYLDCLRVFIKMASTDKVLDPVRFAQNYNIKNQMFKVLAQASPATKFCLEFHYVDYHLPLIVMTHRKWNDFLQRKSTNIHQLFLRVKSALKLKHRKTDSSTLKSIMQYMLSMNKSFIEDFDVAHALDYYDFDC